MTKYDERPLRLPTFWTRRRERFTDKSALSKRSVLHAEVARAPRRDNGLEARGAELTESPAGATTAASEHDEGDAKSVAVLVDVVPHDLPEDTVITPVVGDRVHYSRGSGHLVGLLGVVVPADDDAALPSGLRYVLFDDEEWPTVVTVTELDRQ